MHRKRFLVAILTLVIFPFFGAGCLSRQQASTRDNVVIQTPVSKPPIVSTLQDFNWDGNATGTALHMLALKDTETGYPVLNNPFLMNGTTTVFENVFLWRVKDAEDNIVAAGRGYANSPDVGLPGPFEIKAYFDALPQSTKGVLEIYYGSFQDGSDVILLSQPIMFGELKTREVEIYFNNTKKDPNMLDCSKVYPVKRMAVVTDPIQDIEMHELLLGPTVAEKNEGYVTNLPDYVNQPEVYWQGEGLFMNFDQTLQAGVGGSCRVEAIRAQIENTMGDVCTDFGGCYIMVNGNQEEVLQP